MVATDTKPPRQDGRSGVSFIATLWASWAVILLVGALAVPAEPVADLGIYLVAIHSIIAMVALLNTRSRAIAIVLFCAFAARLALLYIDVYVDGIDLPGSGGDTEGYFQSALAIAEDPSLFSGYIYGGVYSKFLGAVTLAVGPYREILQYTNVLASISTVLIVDAVCRQIGLTKTAHIASLLLISFLPNYLIVSTTLLRESFIAFLLAASIYSCMLWMQTQGIGYALLPILFIGAASSLHSGVIIAALVYIVALIFYDPGAQRFVLAVRNIPLLFAAVGSFAATFAVAPDVFMNQFGDLGDAEHLVETANFRAGGAAYLTGLTVENPLQAALFSPIRAFYFLASPLPWDWRSGLDVVTFFMDSAIYMSVGLLAWRQRAFLREHYSFALILLGTVVASIFIFGLGVSNSGTALRHRIKLLPYIALLFGFCIEAIRNGRQRQPRAMEQ